jgi:GntR family transcriptional regulator
VIVGVDPDSPTPPYEQIRAQVATMIAAGTLPPGEQLPPIRQLAADLGLAANTVARAYRELENDGLVVSRVRHGTTVADGGPALPRSEIRRRLAEAATAYATTVRQLGVQPEQAEAAARAALHAATRTAPHTAARAAPHAAARAAPHAAARAAPQAQNGPSGH